VNFLEERLPKPSSIGVLELDALPWSVAEPIAKSRYGPRLVDATGLFAAIRQPADEVEIQLAQRAARIAAQAFGTIPPHPARASEVLSALEGSARRDGAEEVLPHLAPDLHVDATLRRFEGDAPLGERFAVELSVAYKATWVRVVRCFSSNGSPQSWRRAGDWFVEAAARLNETNFSVERQAAPPGKLAAWTLESCFGSPPLSVAATNGASAGRALPGGSLASLSLHVDLDDGPWLSGVPLVVGSAGRPSRLLI
jgi:hypothetical protein